MTESGDARIVTEFRPVPSSTPRGSDEFVTPEAARAGLAVLLLAVIVSIFSVVYNPLIQDDGWNAAIVLSEIHHGDPFAHSPVDGFVTDAYRAYYSVIHHGLQEVLVRGFGESYVVFRLNALIGGVLSTLAIFLIVLRLTSSVPPAVFAASVFVLHPFFFVHAFNRNEMVALPIALASLALMIDVGQSASAAPRRAALAYFLPFAAFDVHPISVMLVVGYGFFLFFSRRDVLLPALAGGATGVMYLVFSKTYPSGDFRALAGLFGLDAHRPGRELIDHYIPVTNFRLDVAVYRESVRLTSFIKLALFSGLWVVLLLRFRSLIQSSAFRTVGLVVVSMWLFSVFFFSQAGNGYHLYVWAAFIILAACLVWDAAVWARGRFRAGWVYAFFAIPFALVIGRGVVNFHLPAYRSHDSARAAYEALPPSLGLRPGDVIAARPTFWFLFHDSPYPLIYQFLATLVMASENVDFIEAHRRLGATIVGLDDPQLEGFWYAENVPATPPLNLFYNDLPRISRQEFTGYINSGVLTEIVRYDDPTHGLTTFYRIDYTRHRPQRGIASGVPGNEQDQPLGAAAEGGRR